MDQWAKYEKVVILYLYLQGHGHWVNTLALSTEYVLRTGPFDYKPKQCNSADEMKEVYILKQ